MMDAYDYDETDETADAPQTFGDYMGDDESLHVK